MVGGQELSNEQVFTMSGMWRLKLVVPLRILPIQWSLLSVFNSSRDPVFFPFDRFIDRVIFFTITDNGPFTRTVLRRLFICFNLVGVVDGRGQWLVAFGLSFSSFSGCIPL